LLYEALLRLGEIRDVGRERFRETIAERQGAVGPVLENLGVEMEHAKVPLAQSVADILNAATWWKSEEVMSADLGAFLSFLQKVE